MVLSALPPAYMLPTPTQRFRSLKTDLALLKLTNSHEEIRQFHALAVKNGSIHHMGVSSRILSLYASPEFADVEPARYLFDQISQPNSMCWNSIIKCYVENCCSDEALILFCKLMSESDVLPDKFTYPCVIKACSRLSAIVEGKQIHGLVLKTGFGGDVFVQSSLVSLYSKSGDIRSATRVFEKMRCRDLVTWNCLIDGYAKCGQIDIARRLFDEMSERDIFSWTALIDGFSKCGEIEAAREIFDQMPERNVISWNAMINGYARVGDVETARELLNEMPTKSVATWNIMIAGYKSIGRFMNAIESFLSMLKDDDIKPNHATLVCTLSAVSELGILKYGRWLHSHMSRIGFQIDGVLGTSLIDMYSKCGCIDSARRVFDTISRRKLGHWTAVIVGLGTHGRATEALEMFIELERIGIKPNDITFVGVLNACSHSGIVDEGRHYFKKMVNEYGITPTIEHYGCLVDLLCRAGHLEEAKDIIEKKMPVKPNKVIWMSLLSGCRTHKNIDMGEYAAKRVIELDPRATGCHMLLSNIYAAAQQWDKVSEVREVMKISGARKDPGRSSIEYEGLIHNFVAGDRSHPQAEEIYSKLKEMRERLRGAGYTPDTSQVLLCVEEKEKEAELSLHSERLAIAFGLINVKPGIPIRVVKNLRVCNDCHAVTNLLSSVYACEIIVRDGSRFHHFKNGSCSCNDFW